MMGSLQSMLNPLGLVLMFLAALRGPQESSGVFAFAAVLILTVTTYPPADARRGARAALVLAGGIGLSVLGSLFDEVRAGRPQALDDLVALLGAALVFVDAAGHLLEADIAPRPAPVWEHADPAHSRPMPAREEEESHAGTLPIAGPANWRP